MDYLNEFLKKQEDIYNNCNLLTMDMQHLFESQRQSSSQTLQVYVQLLFYKTNSVF